MADQTRLTESEINALVVRRRELPAAYLNYLREFGWGQSRSGHMIYSGPISPNNVYPDVPDNFRILLGDDMQGFCLGYDNQSKRFGEYSDSGEWTSFGASFDLAKYLNLDAA